MDVANALPNKAMREIKMPSSEQERRAVARNFSRIRNLPRVVGAIECKTLNNCPEKNIY